MAKFQRLLVVLSLFFAPAAFAQADPGSDVDPDGTIVVTAARTELPINALPLTAAQKNALQVIYAPTVNQEGELYPAQPFGGEGQTAGWPTQVIHTDYYPANVLVAGDAVSGILDFEYAGRGHRAMDVAIGLAAFSNKRWDDWSWPVCRAFAEGYLRRLKADLQARP